MIIAEFYGTLGSRDHQLFLNNYWGMIREKRNELIKLTDWSQTSDAPLTPEKKAEFTAYRQALRDIPQTYDNPDDIVWPTKPTI